MLALRRFYTFAEFYSICSSITVQAGCSQVSCSGANTIFIEKRKSFPRACAGDKPPTRSLRSDPQCFSHEDGCFAPLTDYKGSLPEPLPTSISNQTPEPLPSPISNQTPGLLPTSISNQTSELLPTSISVQTRCNELSRTYEKQFTRFRHVFHNFGPINTQFLHIYFRKYDL